MVIDVTDATFESEVLQRSMTTPVVVDLWAPWCEPCKTLGPILENVVNGTNGKVVLTKINVDENPQVSQAFKVQSIPAVYALDKGEVVATFMGAQPEAQIREFVNGLLSGEMSDEVGALLGLGDEESLRKAVELEPENPIAVALLGQLLLSEERLNEAIEVLSAGPEEDANISQLLQMARDAALSPDAKSGIESQLGELLPEVKLDDDARSRFLSLLDELSTGDPAAAADWRRRLSTQLF